MNNFPYYNQLKAEVIFKAGVEIEEKLVDKIAEELINKLGLKVVAENKHEFSNGGLTKVYILSQSHLIFHTWPENRAIHVDLITCSKEVDLNKVENILRENQIEDLAIEKS
jgi:S-adenosylmethionine/arginine decarboxylase-like enzyme